MLRVKLPRVVCINIKVDGRSDWMLIRIFSNAATSSSCDLEISPTVSREAHLSKISMSICTNPALHMRLPDREPLALCEH